MRNLRLDEETFERERQVIISERRDQVDDDVEGKASEVLAKLAFRDHGYRHPIIGWMNDIRAHTLQGCKRFYGRYYAPNNATLVVAGAFDEAALMEELQARYGVMKRSRIAARPKVHEGGQRRERRRTIEFETRTEKVAIGYRAPENAHPDWRVLQMLAEILLSGRQSRIYRRLVLDDELASQAYSYLAPSEEPGLYEIWLGARDGVSGTALLDVVDEEITRLLADGVSEDELEATKARGELTMLSSLESVAGKAEQIGFDELILGDACASFDQIDALRAISTDDAMRVARQYLRKGSRSVVFVRPRGVR